jgi:hypothetical protein
MSAQAQHVKHTQGCVLCFIMCSIRRGCHGFKLQHLWAVLPCVRITAWWLELRCLVLHTPLW